MINELSDGEVAEGIYTLSQAIRLCLAGEHNCVQRFTAKPSAGFRSSFLSAENKVNLKNLQ